LLLVVVVVVVLFMMMINDFGVCFSKGERKGV